MRVSEDELRQLRCWSALLLLAGARLDAQAAATVPASSALYDRLESVSAYFPVRGVFLGERPLSQRDVRRIVERLSAAIDSAQRRGAIERAGWARRELNLVTASLNETFGVHRAGRNVVAIASRADASASDAQPVVIAPNGLGIIDAISHPFEPGRHGWPVGRGAGGIADLTGLLGFGSQVALAVEPVFFGVNRVDSGQPDARLHRVYGRGVWHNAALQIGAEELRWGQSPTMALFVSGNAAPFPAIRVSTDTSITLPWVLRFAGPVRATLFVADLGRAQDPPHTKLAGWLASVQPSSRFELGVSVLAQEGGNGAPPATFFKRAIDLFPIIDALAPQHVDLQFSNKFAGGNLRVRVPELSGLDLYYELQFDDFDLRRLRSSFVDDAGQVVGARLPLLVRNGQLAWRAEWVRTSLRLYEHTQFRSGLTYRDRLIGSPLGPHAAAGAMSLTWQPSPASQFAIEVGDERRDPSLYRSTATAPEDSDFRLERVTDDPDVRRRRVVALLERPSGPGAVRVTLGYNRRWTTGGPARSEWLGQVAFRSQLLRTF
ncbi:MAG TPA: capsule assembly Wzi family protein [Gemmatimonadaceae bacterium]|nr:capsule assembly Wzi family protein [Gemmatimonadaceae bacterium]